MALSVLAEIQWATVKRIVDRESDSEAWGDVLSLGEQQRLTFARILLNQPDFAILDEATSALDLANEARLYSHLRHTGTTFISVGHRESLHEYHQNTLKLGEDHTWALSIPGVAPADS